MDNQYYNDTNASERRTVELTIPDVPFLVNEAINTLRGNIQLSGYDMKTICITSALIHEGKSSVSFRLAKSYAALGKRTLFLDCDIRNSAILSRYQVKQNGYIYGLTEYLCGEIGIQDAIWGTQDPFLDILFSGSIAPNPSELFSGELFRSLLRWLRGQYDYIIVDTPPVNAVIDGLLIAKECDGTVLVVESGVSDRRQSMHAVQQLNYANVKTLGVVLNKAGHHKGVYGYGYGYGYGHRYGYGYGSKYGYGYGQKYGYGYGEVKEEKEKKANGRRGGKKNNKS